MRKGTTEGYGAMPFDNNVLQDLKTSGYMYVQIKGLTADKHYDYIALHFAVLVSENELPLNMDKKKFMSLSECYFNVWVLYLNTH
jgi:hypothetical protein